MDPDSTILLLLVLVSFVALVMTSLADTGLASLSRARVQHQIEQGTARMRALEPFVERPATYLQAQHTLRTLLTVASAILGSLFVAYQITDRLLVVVVSLLAVFALAALANSVPRALAAGRSESVVLALAPYIRVSAFVLGPIVQALARLGSALASATGARPLPEGPLASTEELRTLVTVGEEERLIEENEREMIDSIFDLVDTTAHQIMVPRMDIAAVSASTSVADAIDVIVARGFSRLPVYEETIDDVVGILYAKDIFRHLRHGKLDQPVSGLVRPAYFIPESKKIDELLRDLQAQKVHIAVVVDEYGGTAGLVTIEDLIEEIVGEIQDEHDREEAKIIEVSDDEALFDATVSIHDVNDTLSLDLEGEDVDTVGGLVYERLGKVPSPGDEIRLNGTLISVVTTVGRRIKMVRVQRVHTSGATAVAESSPDRW